MGAAPLKKGRGLGEYMLEIQSLNVNYGPRQVLQDISFNVANGEIVSLIGPNGSGKTTLIRAISGVRPAAHGQMLVDGTNLARLNIQQRARLLAVVPQARDLPEMYTVEETVLLGRTPYLNWLGKLLPPDRQQVEWVLERTDTQLLKNRLVGELSGGEQQRVLLARALAQDTPILLLDEPTSHLDINHQTHLLDLIVELTRENNLAVLMALHDLNLAALYSHKIALLFDGRLRAFGAPAEVLTTELLSAVYHLPLNVITHPDYGTPLILPDGLRPATSCVKSP
jgi:iron complex transport system ATP-binding protein